MQGRAYRTAMTIPTIKLSAGPEVSRIALGCMGMAGMYGDADEAEGIATARGAPPAQLAIAGVLAKGPSIVPVIGARTRRQLDESLGALAIRLSPGELAEIEQAMPASEVAGARYAAPQMQMLDSERSQ